MKKSNKGKMPAGAPKGINPLEFFRKSAEQTKKRMQPGGAYKKASANNNSSTAAAVSSNPFAKGNGLTPITPSMTSVRTTGASRVIPKPTPSTTSASVSVTPTPTPVPAKEPSFREKKKAMKETGKLERLEAKNNLKKAKIENLKKQYESGDRKAATAGDKIDRAVKVGETVIQGMDAINKFRKPIGELKRGGSIKRKSKKK